MRQYSRQRRETWVDDIFGGAVVAVGFLVIIAGALS